MNLQFARNFKKEFIINHPQHEEQVNDSFQLMLDEIEEGESEMNEVNHFISSCDDLLIED